MSIKNTLTISYYGILGLVVAGQVIFTVLQTSLVVDHSQQLKSLEQRQQELAAEKQSLEIHLATTQSLTALENDPTLLAFESIAQPVIVSVNTNLAAR